MLYGGGFFSHADRREMDRVQTATPAELAKGGFRFQDARLPEMLLRYRARNWPETLTGAERSAWDSYRRRRLTEPDGGGSLTLDAYREALTRLGAEHAEDPARGAVLSELATWGDGLLPPAP